MGFSMGFSHIFSTGPPLAVGAADGGLRGAAGGADAAEGRHGVGGRGGCLGGGPGPAGGVPVKRFEKKYRIIYRS